MAELNFLQVDKMAVQGRSALYPNRVGEGVANELWAAKDGALVSFPWVQGLVLEGRCFNMTVGTLSTGIVGGGNGTTLDLDQPEFLVSVPAGTVIMPLKIAIQGNAADAVADHSVLEALVCVDVNYKWAADGTATTETAYNLRTDGPKASACSCASAFTADMTASSGADTTHHIDLARAEVKIDLPANGETPIILDLNWQYNNGVAPFIVGPALVTGYWGGTSAVTGYAQVFWAEWGKSELGI